MEKLGNRKITICKELTKKHEKTFLTTISEAIAFYEETDPRGEYVLVIEGRTHQDIKEEEQQKWEEISIEEHMDIYLGKGMSKKDAMKAVAKDRGISKRDVYQQLL